MLVVVRWRVWDDFDGPIDTSVPCVPCVVSLNVVLGGVLIVTIQ